MIVIEQHTVPKNIPKIRLLDYALSVFTTVSSRSSLKKKLKKEALLVDGQPGSGSNWVVANQQITLVEIEDKPPKPLNFKLDIVFEDEHIAIVNKPAGIEVSGNKYYTIQNALISNIKKSNEPDALAWAKPVHRLDMPTSGLLLIAKTAKAIMDLGKQFENREITKKYIAVVAGKLPDVGEISTKIGNQNATSSYKCLNRCHSLKIEWLSLTQLIPHTGRTHQLRIHMASIGFPIVGDSKYGVGPLLRGKGLFLSAVELIFKHPCTKETVTITVRQPKKFDAIMEREERRWQKYFDG